MSSTTNFFWYIFQWRSFFLWLGPITVATRAACAASSGGQLYLVVDSAKVCYSSSILDVSSLLQCVLSTSEKSLALDRDSAWNIGLSALAAALFSVGLCFFRRDVGTDKPYGSSFADKFTVKEACLQGLSQWFAPSCCRVAQMHP